MGLELAVSRDGRLAAVPGAGEFRAWAEAALSGVPGSFSLSVRVVGAAEGRALNRRWRGKDHPTNVLSFASGVTQALAASLGFTPLGDLVLCAPVVRAEAMAQGKPAADHWAHLTVHGVLHLLGWDHEQPRDAARMEGRERELLAGFGIPDPYAVRGPA